jgi:hypothetical protein
MEKQVENLPTEKAPYQPPTLQKREQLREVVIGQSLGSIVT